MNHKRKNRTNRSLAKKRNIGNQYWLPKGVRKLRDKHVPVSVDEPREATLEEEIQRRVERFD